MERRAIFASPMIHSHRRAKYYQGLTQVAMAISQIHQPTFMLLPTFDYDPETSPIVLGTILGRRKQKTDRFGRRAPPDPQRPFTTRANILSIPPESSHETRVLRNFHVHFKETDGRHGEVFADLSLLGIAGGRFSAGGETVRGLEVDCRAEEVTHGSQDDGKIGVGTKQSHGIESITETGGITADQRSPPTSASVVERTTFEPSLEYISQAIESNRLARDYVAKEWWKGRGRSVFMVTGTMVVKGSARISIYSSDESEVGVGVQADLTAATGGTVPLSVGAGADRRKARENRREFEVDGPFILAYRLRRVRVSRKGIVTGGEDYNEFALMGADGQANVPLDSGDVTLDDVRKENDEESSELDSEEDV